ncbi:MAG: ribosome biogenesis GTPase Der, partial [Candidatus Krumholzibacteria bacterium]|nr:ribosome biogenesis GTPase Der [Candidatus Krumholzibacteria bacterium]
AGKSTLFNRLVGSRKAITHSTPGVTRDTIKERVVWNGIEFMLVDTGGFRLVGTDPLQKQIADRINKSSDEAAVILFLTDVHTGPNEDDENLLNSLRNYRDKMILVVNKVESKQNRWDVHEFYKLGFNKLYPISSTHGTGVGEILDEIVSRLPRKPLPKEKSALKISIVGKPNVGKSSLVNALVGEDRHIVSKEPGTTRDAINLHLRYRSREVVLVDTAGIKRRSRTDKGLQTISTLKSLESIRLADIVLVLVDATTEISNQDTKIASESHNSRKGIVILINKWDLIRKETKTAAEYVQKVRRAMPFLSYAPVMTISALTGLRINRIFSLCFEIQQERTKRVETSELNRLIDTITTKIPPRFYKQATGKIYYITQTGIMPPTFTLFVNKASYFPRSYIRYLNNQIRKNFTFVGTSVRISLKSKGR